MSPIFALNIRPIDFLEAGIRLNGLRGCFLGDSFISRLRSEGPFGLASI